MSDTGCWYPATHRYQGGCDPASRLVLPHYPTMPGYIKVYDTAVRTQGWAREYKRAWRLARANALYRWGLSAENFVIKEKGLVDGDYLPGGITLRMQSPTFQSSNNYGGFGLYPLEPAYSMEYHEPSWEEAKGIVQMHPKTVGDAFAGRNYNRMTGVMAHEFGHALGFGHGGDGLMRAAMVPPYVANTEERAALRSYWGIS